MELLLLLRQYLPLLLNHFNNRSKWSHNSQGHFQGNKRFFKTQSWYCLRVTSWRGPSVPTGQKFQIPLISQITDGLGPSKLY